MTRQEMQLLYCETIAETKDIKGTNLRVSLNGSPLVSSEHSDVCLLSFSEEGDYSLQKNRFSLGGIEVPVPETHELCMNQTYYVKDASDGLGYSESYWDGDNIDQARLNNRSIWLNEEDIIEVIEAERQLCSTGIEDNQY